MKSEGRLDETCHNDKRVLVRKEGVGIKKEVG